MRSGFATPFPTSVLVTVLPTTSHVRFKAKPKPPPTLQGRKGHKFIPSQQEASGGATFPGPTGDTQEPSFMPLVLNELEAGQGPRGKPGLGLGGVSWCARGPRPVQDPPTPIIGRGHSWHHGDSPKRSARADPMGVGILQGDYRTTMSFKFTVFKHVSYSNFSQQLLTESQDSIHLRKA